MNKSINKIIKSHIILSVCTLVAVALLVTGVTYSLFQIDKENTTNQTIAIGNLSAHLSSIEGAVVLNDIYPKLSTELTEEDKIYKFTVTNDGDFDIRYTIYLKDATDVLLSETTTYSEYNKLSEEYYQYIDFLFNGSATPNNLSNIKKGDRFVLLTGTLPKRESKDYTLQFFIDKGETTASGAPNSIEGSVLSLDVYMEASIFTSFTAEDTLAKLGKTSKDIEGLDFANAATTDETSDGLYAMEDDYGTSYFYRGDVADNYVRFAGLYWRIIRVNGDGSVRMIYDGTSAHTNTDTSTDRLAWRSQSFNELYDDAKYVGYMYGPADATEGTTTASSSKEEAHTNTASSYIKTPLEYWYLTNIKNKNLDNYVADSVFCYDRTTPGKTLSGWTDDTGLGYAKNATAYGAYARLGVASVNYNNVHPQFICPNKNDAFTKEDTRMGNGATSEKIGLISADEVVAGGSGKYGTINQSYYLHKGNVYWSGSPSYYSINGAVVFVVVNVGNLAYIEVDTAIGAAPVINLTAEYFNTFVGDGTIGNVFRSEDENNDGIPDKYQVTVTLNVENGFFSDGNSTKDIVLTLRDEDGNLSEAGSAKISSSEIPSISPIPGCTNGAWENSLNPADITFTKESETLTFKYIYVPFPAPTPSITHTLTINYLDKNGQFMVNTFSEQYEEGESFSIPSPDIPGYTPNLALVEGTMQNKDITFTIVYSPIPEIG